MRCAEAERVSRNLQRGLLRDGRLKAAALAKLLGRCSPEAPCLSPACIPCARAFQRAAVDLLAHETRYVGPWVVIDAISSRCAVRRGDLAGRDPFTPVANRLRVILGQARLRAIGGVDISFNEHETGAFEDHYRPHGRFLVLGHYARVVRTRLKPFFPTTRLVKRPLLVRDFDPNLNGLAYLFKPVFEVRRSLDRPLDKNGRPHGRSTRADDMRVAERVEIALAAHRASLDDRVILSGCRMIEHNGKLGLIPT